MDNRKFGYIRVSSRDQNEARQLQSMKEVGISNRDIFIDKQSGKDFNREQYQSLKHHLRTGDVLYIHSLDRFGRNKEEILNEWTDITKKLKVDIVVLDMPLLDTTKYQDSLGTFISDLVLQILSWLAEEERERIKKRQREGIDVAQQNGIKFGRPKAELTNAFITVYKEWKAERITATEAMKIADLKRTTFYKLVREYEEQQANL
ncbi:recombinase family protein [Bacillus sp. ISL-40]|uniref:recombinase family protein n=1 Tax=unclassified Bacillus (in: firmicutes) TaxID=185979 RepID=UPI001BED08F0|nr:MULTISPECIES: recombinase family protein [unclassified Bacillus (in: firmicutes)]MBT2700386.1 recombinase family protein [Bacillus sp. ISL-40]MBT2742419.1 recombinase family protein [Bacillus sp. ISL-77]